MWTLNYLYAALKLEAATEFICALFYFVALSYFINLLHDRCATAMPPYVP